MDDITLTRCAYCGGDWAHMEAIFISKTRIKCNIRRKASWMKISDKNLSILSESDRERIMIWRGPLSQDITDWMDRVNRYYDLNKTCDIVIAGRSVFLNILNNLFIENIQIKECLDILIRKGVKPDTKSINGFRLEEPLHLFYWIQYAEIGSENVIERGGNMYNKIMSELLWRGYEPYLYRSIYFTRSVDDLRSQDNKLSTSLIINNNLMGQFFMCEQIYHSTPEIMTIEYKVDGSIIYKLKAENKKINQIKQVIVIDQAIGFDSTPCIKIRFLYHEYSPNYTIECHDEVTIFFSYFFSFIFFFLVCYIVDKY